MTRTERVNGKGKSAALVDKAAVTRLEMTSGSIIK